jgi:hypothetical protein
VDAAPGLHRHGDNDGWVDVEGAGRRARIAPRKPDAFYTLSLTALCLPVVLLAQVKPFIKVVNYTHLMPTRYALEVELKSIVTTDVVSSSQANPTARTSARKEVKKLMEEKYNSSLKTGKNSAQPLVDRTAPPALSRQSRSRRSSCLPCLCSHVCHSQSGSSRSCASKLAAAATTASVCVYPPSHRRAKKI